MNNLTISLTNLYMPVTCLIIMCLELMVYDMINK